MADRDKILRYFKASGDEELAARLVDLAEAARKTGRYKVSEFLDPHGRNVAEIVAANFEGIRLETDGGFANAERCKTAFVAEDSYGTPDFGIVCYLVTWDKRYYTLGHRDILGAFMGMGCEREILGDIVLVPEGAQFVADKAFKIISATVAALRLDAVAAAGYGISRSRMAEEIKSQNVKLNWKEARSASQSVAEGDVMSFRGRGRVELSEVRGTTKKGRFAITLKRYI